MLAAFRKEGYVLSRHALYLCLIPRQADKQIEGKRHVRTVPVKLRKTKNTLRDRHADPDFTFVIKRQMRDIVSLFESDVFVLSADNKAKVPIGVTAVVKQAPLIMHASYEIRLPDHNFVKATKHKLTPSVYATCEIKPLPQEQTQK